MNPAVPLLCLLAGVGMAWGAAPQAPDEILSAVQTRLESGAPLEDLIEALDDLPSEDLNTIEAEVEKAWSGVRQQYLDAFRAAAEEQHTGTARQDTKTLVRDLRASFHEVRRMAEGPMKEALNKTSMPAMTQLRELLVPSPDRILTLGGKPLQLQHSVANGLAKFRNGIREANVSTGEEDSLALLRAAEDDIASEFSGLDRSGLRIMDDNRKLAAKVELLEPERLGIEELNTMRLLVDLPALRLDPKLCEAARGHSRDMKEHNFFAHASPLPGKTSPSDRAALAGTTGGGENIYSGSTDPRGANRGWFFSPGHHKNMFNPGYGRVGLGHFASHWTQMFGG